jgi:hypothetical protein
VSNYRILLRGVKPGRSADQVALALARYSKKTPEQLRALFASGKHMVAKRTALAQEATKYKLLLDKLGCDCLIEAEITNPAEATGNTSVLVTDVADAAYTGAPRRGVTYAQASRSRELAEKIGSAFRSRPFLLLILCVALYFGWQHLRA